MSRARLLLTVALPASLLLPAVARGQQCESHQDERALGHLDGLRIDSVDVEVAAPVLPSGIAGVASRLHARTDPSTVRRLFDQSSGTTIDTLGSPSRSGRCGAPASSPTWRSIRANAARQGA